MATQAEVKTESRKIAVNRCFGGFGLSEAAFMEFMRRKGHTIYSVPGGLGPSYWRTPIDQLPPILLRPSYEASSREEWREAAEKAGEVYEHQFVEERDDPDLIAVIEEMGDAASGFCAAVGIAEIPADVEWEIEEYDGKEWVSEAHRTW